MRSSTLLWEHATVHLSTLLPLGTRGFQCVATVRSAAANTAAHAFGSRCPLFPQAELRARGLRSWSRGAGRALNREGRLAQCGRGRSSRPISSAPVSLPRCHPHTECWALAVWATPLGSASQTHSLASQLLSNVGFSARSLDKIVVGAGGNWEARLEALLPT